MSWRLWPFASRCLEHNAGKAWEPVFLLSMEKHQTPVTTTSVDMGQRPAHASHVLHSCAGTFQSRLRNEFESVWQILITRWEDHHFLWTLRAITGRSWPAGRCSSGVELGRPKRFAEKTGWWTWCGSSTSVCVALSFHSSVRNGILCPHVKFSVQWIVKAIANKNYFMYA